MTIDGFARSGGAEFPSHGMSRSRLQEIRTYSRDRLSAFVDDELAVLGEDEALALLGNRFVDTAVLQKVANTPRLVAFYSVRLRLVAHRATPQAHAVKLVHYLHWTDLLRLSMEVQVPATTRRAIDTQLLQRLGKLSLGEKIGSAKRCSSALIKALLFDPDPKVFAALLLNQRVREDDLLHFAGSDRALPEQLRMLASDGKWSYRYAIRKALVLNPLTPRAAAASQLRFLSTRDLQQIHRNPATSVYLRRCIERLGGSTAGKAAPDRGDRA